MTRVGQLLLGIAVALCVLSGCGGGRTTTTPQRPGQTETAISVAAVPDETGAPEGGAIGISQTAVVMPPVLTPRPTHTTWPGGLPNIAGLQSGAVTVLGLWGGSSLTSFQEVVYPFTQRTGIGMAYEGTRDLASVLDGRIRGKALPDLVVLPNSAMLKELAGRGLLVPLDSFLDMAAVKKDYGPAWLDLGNYEGKLYGLVYQVSVKSLVWYNPKAFQAHGYQVPATWQELIDLSDRIVADGGTPWCMGLESGQASGWPGTDWIEDIMLRSAGPELYDRWTAHEIAWTDPAVRHTWELLGQIARNDEYLYGGSEGALSTNFADSPAPLFASPPGCYMHHQAPLITGFFPSRAHFGDDYDFFLLPPIDPRYDTPIIGNAQLIVLMNSTPQAQALINYLSGPDPQELWASRGDFISPSRAVSSSAYPDELTRRIADRVVNAGAFRFDASDEMPSAVGCGSFWKGVRDYVGGVDLDTVLRNIEASAAEAYR